MTLKEQFDEALSSHEFNTVQEVEEGIKACSRIALNFAITTLKSLKTSRWSEDVNENFRLLWLTKLTELETQLEKLENGN
jgi:hypothetical protein